MLPRLLADVPPSGWAIVVFAAVRAAALSACALAVGAGVDALAAGADPLAWWVASLGALVVAACAAAAEALVPARARPAIEAEWRARVARRALADPLDGAEPAGERVDRATGEVERFAHYRADFLGPLVAGAVVPAVVLTVLGIGVSWPLAGGLAVLVALAPLLIAGFLARFRASSGRYRRVAAGLAGLFLESMRARQTLRLLDATAERRAALVRRSAALRGEVMALLRRNQLVILVTDAIFGVLALSAVGCAGAWGVGSGALSLGQAAALLVIAGLLREPVDRLGRSFYVGLAGRAAGERIRAALAASPGSAGEPAPRADVALRADAGAVDGAPASDALLTLSGAVVEREGVRVIDQAELAIPARGLTALVGESGAGKSTLALALAGLVPSRGIRLGSEQASEDGLRASVAYIPQRPVLVLGTVRDNLLLAQPGAGDGRMRAALAAAGLAASELPDGLGTPVGEHARGVSGGQAQRIAIARAVLTERPVLIADEPTAHLDPAASRAVIDTLVRLAGDRAVVLVTHRPDEAQRADRVARVAGGRIAAVAGTEERA
ncbi:ABC transporter ATP-binding protein [Microbacterium excoecariae]|uniref:ATP-binding cassette domain-containing protein n=1 Tax=Microbacterium excoecariae TaxID=2715210 RepID=UPI00140C68D9|nr:ABC transporter ATP-binding protein [Microbacterium excoecariae]NHI16610.1 ABC transporter ATP-binding protein [Microbacterium excoecariae]